MRKEVELEQILNNTTPQGGKELRYNMDSLSEISFDMITDEMDVLQTTLKQ